jgi:murein DD-endopeptidase MepM/ murein hydrolase activator NlpD
MPRLLITSLLLALFALAPVAYAGDGSAEVPTYGGTEPGELTAPQQSVDPNAATDVEKPKPEPKQETPGGGPAGRPLLTSFSVSSSRLFVYGRGTRVTYRITDNAPVVNVSLKVIHATTGQTAKVIDLGSQTTGTDHVHGLKANGLAGARYRIRVVATDPGGHKLTRKAGVSALDEIAVYGHRFPLKGNFPYGDAGSRFGAPRSGHSHQGQDIAAPEGTRILAPRGGRVKVVAYQKGGAGYYVIIDGAGENREYAFMHMQEGSTRVREGQWVRTGKWIGNVGNTGGSSGAHLHFEIWEGPWYAGGKPVDPFHLLQSWDRWS